MLGTWPGYSWTRQTCEGLSAVRQCSVEALLVLSPYRRSPSIDQYRFLLEVLTIYKIEFKPGSYQIIIAIITVFKSIV